MAEHTVTEALLAALGVGDPSGMGAALDALASSGVDVSALTPDQLVDLLADAGVLDADHASGSGHQVRFGGGRWEGQDQWGNPVQQSPGSPPTNSDTGAEVDPLDVTWNT